jgi:hypothetical protein
MRRLLAVAVLGAAAGTAAAQSGTATGGVSTTRAGGGVPLSMPGQVVGSGFNLSGSAPQPVGGKLPPVGDPMMRRYDPSRPLDALKGTGIDPSTVIAPISAFPPVPAPEKNLIDRLYDKLDSALSFKFSRTPEPVARPKNVTPGIFRRNRERTDAQAWRRD